MNTILQKPITPVAIVLLVILVVALIVVLAIHLVSCKKKPPQDCDQSDVTGTTPREEKPGEHKRSQDPDAPKDIASTDLLSFDMHMVNASDDIHGSFDLGLHVFDENDAYLVRKAGDNTEPFKESGYILSIGVSADRSYEFCSGISIALPVDKDFTTRFAKIVRQSGIMAINGKYDWTSGLPVNAGEFILSGKYASGDYLGISINAYVPTRGIDLFRALRPLLIDALMNAGEDYVPLLNLDSGTTTPEELIKTIHLSQSHMTLIDSYSFTLMIDSGQGYLAGSFTDKAGQHRCEYVEIDDSDSERLVRAFVHDRYYYALIGRKDDSNETGGYPGVVYDETTDSFTVSFRGVRESFYPIYGVFDETNEDLHIVFRELVKKYGE
jgi:hypothetical protein